MDWLKCNMWKIINYLVMRFVLFFSSWTFSVVYNFEVSYPITIIVLLDVFTLIFTLIIKGVDYLDKLIDKVLENF